MLDVMPSHPQKINRVVALLMQGKTTHQVALETNTNPDSVRRTASRLRKKGFPIPVQDGHGRIALERRVQIVVENAIYNRLALEAAQRNKTPEALVERLLWLIARENLFGAVLDD